MVYMWECVKILVLYRDTVLLYLDVNDQFFVWIHTITPDVSVFLMAL